MSSSMLERLRSNHEDIETHERTIVGLLEQKPRTHREQILVGHRVSNLVDSVVELGGECEKIFADEDKMFKEELSSMRGPNVFSSFYERLKELREYHRRFPDIPPPQPEPDITKEMNPTVQFSGEEMYGKYLDLHEFYHQYQNLPQLHIMSRHEAEESEKPEAGSYISYISYFFQFDKVPRSKKTPDVRQHIHQLFEYILSFYKRTNPLTDVEELLKETESSFEKDWKEGNVRGWPGLGKEEDASAFDLESFSSADELEKLGLDRLKELLTAFGLKCGGSLQERASRLFSIKGLDRDQIPKKIRAKNFESIAPSANGTKDGDVAPTSSSSSLSDRSVALKEYKLYTLCEKLSPTIEATIIQTQKKQTRTREEIEAEMLEEEEGALADIDLMDDEDDDDVPFYNPKNLPLGWDGKPIPYWLYKLHGLGVEYKCEICGNHSYWGRRAFDRHFQEWRHAHGMRCLKIPNTKHFHDITNIEDAYALYAKIKDQLEEETFKPEMEEEFEDSEGNVLNKRTYEDLARQGLL